MRITFSVCAIASLLLVSSSLAAETDQMAAAKALDTLVRSNCLDFGNGYACYKADGGYAYLGADKTPLPDSTGTWSTFLAIGGKKPPSPILCIVFANGGMRCDRVDVGKKMLRNESGEMFTYKVAPVSQVMR